MTLLFIVALLILALGCGTIAIAAAGCAEEDDENIWQGNANFTYQAGGAGLLAVALAFAAGWLA